RTRRSRGYIGVILEPRGTADGLYGALFLGGNRKTADSKTGSQRTRKKGTATMNELSDTKIRNAKPVDKEYTLADGQGLSVRVQANGTRIWLYRYRFGGKRKNMSFGVFPAVTIKLPRHESHGADKLLDLTQDPRSL